jgi:hypothetical protein
MKSRSFQNVPVSSSAKADDPVRCSLSLDNGCLWILGRLVKPGDDERIYGASLPSITKPPYPACPTGTAACGTVIAARRGASRSACSTAKVSTTIAAA